MISKDTLNNIMHKFHIDDFIKSQKELLRDNKGGFLIPFEVKITDKEFERYRYLPVDWSLPPLTKKDLPSDFSEKAAKTVDMFRRKTINLDIECMIYFDIETGNVVFCNFAQDEPNEVTGDIYSTLLKGMHIASVYNHPKKFSSPPSGKNFEMLGLDFEEYELILSEKELWILESKEILFDDEIINKIRDKVDGYYDLIFHDINSEFDEGDLLIDNINKRYGDFLLNYLNNKFDNIKLERRYLGD